MIGQQYECNPVSADMVIVDPTAWVFNGTGVKGGQKLPNAVGSEYDRFDPAQARPEERADLRPSPPSRRRLVPVSDAPAGLSPKPSRDLAGRPR